MFSFTKRLLALALTVGSFQVYADCVAEGDGFSTGFGGCYNSNQDLSWSLDNIAAEVLTTFTFNGAKNYCDSLVEGGKSDWRLPTLSEFQNVAWDGGALYLDYGYSASNLRWSSSYGTGKNKKLVAIVSLADGGFMYTSTGGSAHYAICVRRPAVNELP